MKHWHLDFLNPVDHDYFFCAVKIDIPFETEAKLHARGTAKTPDILLSCPVGILF